MIAFTSLGLDSEFGVFFNKCKLSLDISKEHQECYHENMDFETESTSLARLAADVLGKRLTKVIAYAVLVVGTMFAVKPVVQRAIETYEFLAATTLSLSDVLDFFYALFLFAVFAGLVVGLFILAARLTGWVLYKQEIGTIREDVSDIKRRLARIESHLSLSEEHDE